MLVLKVFWVFGGGSDIVLFFAFLALGTELV